MAEPDSARTSNGSNSNDPEQVNFAVDPARAESFYASVRCYWPDLPDGTLIPDYAGVRPKLVWAGRPGRRFPTVGAA